MVISLGGGGNGTDKLFPTNLLSYFKIPSWQQKCWMAARIRKMLSLDRVRPDLSPPQICHPGAVRNGKTIWVHLVCVLSPETRCCWGSSEPKGLAELPSPCPIQEPLVF